MSALSYQKESNISSMISNLSVDREINYNEQAKNLAIQIFDDYLRKGATQAVQNINKDVLCVVYDKFGCELTIDQFKIATDSVRNFNADLEKGGELSHNSSINENNVSHYDTNIIIEEQLSRNLN